MRSSEQIDKIAQALAKVQSELQSVLTDSTNPHFKSKYASLEAVWDTVRGPLTQNGIAVTQPIAYDPGFNGVIVQTVLMHESGQWIASDVPMPTAKLTPQEVGAVISYGRRYGLAAMVGVTQADDDAQGATTKMTTPKAVKSLSDGQQKAIDAIKDTLQYTGITKEQFTAITGMQTLQGKSEGDLNAALAILMEHIDSKGAA